MRILQEQTALNNKDHAFAAWLDGMGWSGRTIKELTGEKAISAYVRDDGSLVCKVYYDNLKCTYRVFV